MQGLDEAARRDPEAEAVTQQRRDLLERHAHVFMQEHHKSHGSRSEVHIGGSQRVGGLQGMPALDPSTTGDTAANFHVESPDDRPNHREIFLILGGNARTTCSAPPQSGHAAGSGASEVTSTCEGIGRRARRP